MHQFYVEIFNKVRTCLKDTRLAIRLLLMKQLSMVNGGLWLIVLRSGFYNTDYWYKNRFLRIFLVLLNIHSLAAIADIRYIKILMWLRRFLVIFLCLVFFVLTSLRNCETMESWKIRLRAVSGSLLSSDLVRGLHARARVEQQSRETAETRAAAREAFPVSRLQQCARSFSCVAPFARWTEKKERLLLVYEKLAILSIKPRSHFRILLYQTGAISHSKVTRETGSVLCRIALWDCFRDTVASFIGRLRIHLPFPRPLPPSPSPMVQFGITKPRTNRAQLQNEQSRRTVVWMMEVTVYMCIRVSRKNNIL